MLKTLLGLMLALFLAPAAALANSYNIQPGDVLQMEVLEDPSLNRSLLVLPDGTVSLPLVGAIAASGKSVDGLRGAISSALAPKFAAAPTVFLSVGQLNPTTQAVANANANIAATALTGSSATSIYAMGEFNKPGKMPLTPGTTLLQFLAESGGLTKFAATKRIQLHRVDSKTGKETVYTFNYKAVQRGSTAPVITLRGGDVIVVPERRLFE
ncbi:MAG: polysaccharide biosynthesis/export family protein [Paracoccaceae bacterium]